MIYRIRVIIATRHDQACEVRVNGRQVLADVTWTRYLNYRRVQYVVYGLSLAHFACNFFIFIPTGRHFRQALFDLLRCRRGDTSRAAHAYQR